MTYARGLLFIHREGREEREGRKRRMMKTEYRLLEYRYSSFILLSNPSFSFALFASFAVQFRLSCFAGFQHVFDFGACRHRDLGARFGGRKRGGGAGEQNGVFQFAAFG